MGETGPEEAEQRSEARSNVFLAATVYFGNQAVPIRIRNVSPNGALVDGVTLPPAGTKIRIERGRLTADAEISWRNGDRGGLQFSEPIDVRPWVLRVGHVGQQRIDQAIESIRRSGTPALDLQSGPESLESISARLDGICERLADLTLSIEFGEELLKLEAVASSLRRHLDQTNSSSH